MVGLSPVTQRNRRDAYAETRISEQRSPDGVAEQGQPVARSSWYQVAGRPPISVGPTGTNPALVSTFWDATFSRVVIALSVRSPYCAAASRHSSRTVAVATPRPATCCATR